MDVTLGLAFIAGLVSFVSPCVLPLVPAYIGYMSGRVTNTVASQIAINSSGTAVMTHPTPAMRFNTLLNGVAFVLGFTFIFVAFGLLLTALAGILNVTVLSDIIGRVGGVIIIFFGLHFMGILPSVFSWIRRQPSPAVHAAIVTGMAIFSTSVLLWGFGGRLDVWNSRQWTSNAWAPTLGIIFAVLILLAMFLSQAFMNPRAFLLGFIDWIDAMFYADTRQHMDSVGGGLGSSFLMGVVFSAGWTPCIGPVYGTILTVAAQTGDAGYALPLLTAYSLGLGLPFLLSALLLDGAQSVLRRLQRHMRTIKLVTGALLVFIGTSIATGRLQELSQGLASQFSDFSAQVEDCVVGWADGDIYFSQVGDCLGGATDADTLKQQNLGQKQAS
ncbi:MAG TPA: cytochrome c biogenesis protein CcdA [Phototrophicaceae bacterium]|nr:cytochrome c biogenesis protein CcdA [Phototrophicaceae bacterium]